MSWMDSWSRPRKDQATPAPFYITQASTVKYCRTCGRTIGTRRANTGKKSSATEVKYCSDKCKRQKPSTAPESVEQKVEFALGELLAGRGVLSPLVSVSSGAAPPPLPAGLERQDVDPSGDGEGSALQDVEHDPVTDALAATTTKVKARHQPKKGDPRIILQLSEVEAVVFGHRRDPEKVYGRKRNRARRGAPEPAEWRSVDMEDGFQQSPDGRRAIGAHEIYDDYDDNDSDYGSSDDGYSRVGGVGGVSLRLRPPERDVRNGSGRAENGVGGIKGGDEGGQGAETSEMEKKRLEGQKRADEWEMVKQAARRAVVFGLPVGLDEPRPHGKQQKKKRGKDDRADALESERRRSVTLRKCEALMNGSVVEPSFAKGDWSIRWREE
ncbi:hypothetical protein K431DRAFT_338032 [Polychaeton citri CBS 116435]|uniref:Uncharacterized protein n=1 Tax=Polychaeton citri CBS 116435 TaxID=1314669 RepID=A0A9P4QAM8_9PEZI|nr:hypothetical protein K431DRAFT_338032 [Polychaeton citri CBS 116435]